MCIRDRCNIPSGELTMLLTLRRLLLVKTFVIPSDIGDALKLSRPAVSRMLHNLERKGYLEMKSSEEDHRYVKVQFTQAGKKLITEELEKCGTLLELSLIHIFFLELPFPFPYQKEKADKVTFPIKGARGLLQNSPLTLCQESICRYRKSHVKIYEDAWPYVCLLYTSSYRF